MKPLLTILSYVRANDIVRRHWDYYLKADCDIVGIGRETTSCEWPCKVGERRLVAVQNIGEDSYVHGDNLIRLHIDTLDYLLSLAGDYTHFALTEPDAIFLKPLAPECPVYGLRATLQGGRSPGFLGSFFCHGPWILDRHAATYAVNSARRMLKVGLIEQGFPDRFWGLLCDLYDLPYSKFNGYSQNRLDTPQFIENARQAIAGGCAAIHGIKSQEELRAVTEGLA